MKQFSTYLVALSTLFLISCGDDATTGSNNDETSSSRAYESVEGDPMDARIYTLDNGLKVYLSVNKDEPRIQTRIAVRAGSKQDPADATGLAHYLEHMLFKGTSEYGTTNWETEKVILQQISDLYEKRRTVTDEAERTAIYKQIDSLSYEAAKIAIPNEYDKMISSLGARGTNAYTSNEETVYINDIPSNELEKWMSVESKRFQELVLRLFHTELETVYEEFNRGQDNDYRKAYFALTEGLWSKHQYGTQSTIGTGEHLKNPSMEKIHNYFNTYYVPNNMAIILSGDMDPEATMDLIESYFGGWERKDVPEFTFEKEDPITSVQTYDVYGPNAAFGYLGFRFGGVESDDWKYLQLIDGILSNGSAGLIDLNLVQEQKVLNAGTFFNQMADYSMFVMNGTPREGQSLDELNALLLGEMDKIKTGDFPDWLLDAVRKDMKKREISQLEANRARASWMTDAFIQELTWEEVVKAQDELDAITKEELMAFANKNFGDNYIVVRKNEGKDPSTFKVEKPKITELDIERDTTSAFVDNFNAMESPRVKPLFIDYQKQIQRQDLDNGIEMSYIKNETNELFNLFYISEMGGYHDLELPVAVNYLEYLGTNDMTAAEVSQEFFKLGLRYTVFSSNDQVYIGLSGLQESFEDGVQLLEKLLANVEANPEALSNMIDGMMKQRRDDQLNKSNILFSGMVNQAIYGSSNPLTDRFSEAQLRELDPEKLVAKLKQLTSYKHQVMYYGEASTDDVAAVLKAHHKTPATLLDYPEPKKYVQQEIDKNEVLFIDFDMVQTEILMLSKDEKYNVENGAPAQLFNEYFGSGLSSIVFQEIREARALAYSAYCRYTTPARMDESHYVRAYVGVQTDKLGDAVSAMLDLMNDMPRSDVQFAGARDAAMKKIETERITKSSVFWSYQRALKMGVNYDRRENIYNELQDMDFDDMQAFFDNHIKGRKFTFLVIGKKSEVNFDVLAELGEVRELTLDQLYAN